MARPTIPNEQVTTAKSLHEKLRNYEASTFQEALATLIEVSESQVEADKTAMSENRETNSGITSREMFEELGSIQEGGTLYVLQRSTPYRVEHVDRMLRNDGHDEAMVYLSGPGGGEYRIVVDCASDRFVMEDKSPGEWRTHSTKLSGFRYRSPNHPQNGESWDYQA